MITGFAETVFIFFKSLGIWGAFLSMVIENIGIPLPTEIGYLIGQNLINQRVHSYAFMVFVLTFGHILGSTISYLIGRYGNRLTKNRLKYWKKIVATQEKLEKWYQKYGNITVFIARFIGYVRPWSSFVAGFANVPFASFLFWTFLGSLIFNMITLFFSNIIIIIWQRYPSLHVVVVFGGLILFSGLLIYEFVKHIGSKRLKK